MRSPYASTEPSGERSERKPCTSPSTCRTATGSADGTQVQSRTAVVKAKNTRRPGSIGSDDAKAKPPEAGAAFATFIRDPHQSWTAAFRITKVSDESAA